MVTEKKTEEKREKRRFFQRYAKLRPGSGVTDETREGRTDQQVGWKSDGK